MRKKLKMILDIIIGLRRNKLDKKVYNHEVQNQKLIEWAILESIKGNYKKARRIHDVAFWLKYRRVNNKKGW